MKVFLERIFLNMSEMPMEVHVLHVFAAGYCLAANTAFPILEKLKHFSKTYIKKIAICCYLTIYIVYFYSFEWKNINI